MLSMCLSIVKIARNKLTIASAGMPPALIYRRHPQSLEEIEIKGMPLGTFIDFPYETRETALNTGDTLLLMSDGFPELFNANNELFGYDRVGDVFMQTANEEVGDIIEHLKTTAAGWSGDVPPKDDIIFVVIKAK